VIQRVFQTSLGFIDQIIVGILGAPLLLRLVFVTVSHLSSCCFIPQLGPDPASLWLRLSDTMT
jgi:hypothetical protein